MKRSIKRFLTIFCICLGILLVIGSAVLIIKDRYEEEKNSKYSVEILSRLHSSMPPFEDSAGYFDIFSAASINIDGVDYIGILSIPSLDIEFPVSASYDVSSVSVYRISKHDAPLALSCKSKS